MHLTEGSYIVGGSKCNVDRHEASLDNCLHDGVGGRYDLLWGLLLLLLR